MPTHHSRKAKIRARMQETGESHRQAAGHIAAHRHSCPDLTVLDGLPYAAGRPVDLRLAAAVVGACRAGCRSCQDELIPRLLGDRVTVAVLAGAVYGLLPLTGMLASPAWQPLARRAQASGDGARGPAAVEAMTAFLIDPDGRHPVPDERRLHSIFDLPEALRRL